MNRGNKKGPLFSEDDQYISLITEKYSYWRKEGIDIDDPGEHDNVGNIFNVTFN